MKEYLEKYKGKKVTGKSLSSAINKFVSFLEIKYNKFEDENGFYVSFLEKNSKEKEDNMTIKELSKIIIELSNDVKKGFTTINSRIDNLEIKLNNHINDFNELKNNFDNHIKDFSDLKTNFNNHLKNFDELKINFSNYKKDFDNHIKEFSNLKNNFEYHARHH